MKITHIHMHIDIYKTYGSICIYIYINTWRSRWGEHFCSLHWRHNDHKGVLNHQPHGCLLNLLFRRRSKKTSKLRVTGPCVGNSPGPVNSPHKGQATQKMLPFDDVIMVIMSVITTSNLTQSSAVIIDEYVFWMILWGNGDWFWTR